MAQYSIHEAKTHLSHLLREAAEGQEVIIANRGRPLAKLVPVRAASRESLLGDLRGKIRVAPDFDAPLADFAEYR